MTRLLIVFALLAGSGAAMASEAITFRPAHWVDGEDLEPTAGDFQFFDLAFSSPTDGWIAGHRYLLHLRGDKIEMAFLREQDYHLRIFALAFLGPLEGWGGVGPMRSRPWPLLHYSGGKWRGTQAPQVTWPFWQIGHIMAGRGQEAWARASVATTMDPGGNARQMQVALLRYDGKGWAPDTTLGAGLGGAQIIDGCQAADGPWWFVGFDTTVPSGMGLFLGRWSEGRLTRVELPAPAAERSLLAHVSCQADGTVWAVGQVRVTPDRPRDVLLMRHDTEWTRVPLPAEFAGLDASAFFVVDAADVWIAVNCVGGVECRARFLHWNGAVWREVEIESLPEGRSTGYSIRDVHFVSPTEGWAIGNDYDGPGLVRGLIFHYRDGTWRNRNWNWHFWDAPWWGLFGH